MLKIGYRKINRLFWNYFKIPPQIPGRKSVDGVGSDGVGHAKHAREESPDVSPGLVQCVRISSGHDEEGRFTAFLIGGMS